MPFERPHDPLLAGVDAFSETFELDEKGKIIVRHDGDQEFRDDDETRDEVAPNQLGDASSLKFDDE